MCRLLQRCPCLYLGSCQANWKAFLILRETSLYVSDLPGIRRIAVTRGRHPVRALEEAEPIAKKRGLVRYYERGPDLVADFSIVIPECLAQVKIKRMRYVRCTLPWLEREAYAEITGLKMFPSSREISRELWICSPDYCWRFFRICDTGLCELGRDGMPLPEKSTVPVPGKNSAGKIPADNCDTSGG